MLALYAVMPIAGDVVVLPGGAPRRLVEVPAGAPHHVQVLPGEASQQTWPRLFLSPPDAVPGQRVTLWVTDVVGWAWLGLTVDGRPARLASWTEDEAASPKTWTWQWAFTMPEAGAGSIVFYRDCHTGCIERGRLNFGAAPAAGTPAPATPPPRPTKLGLVFARPERDWHGRAGWAVDLSYARADAAASDPYWEVDALASRVHDLVAQGHRVLLRVDYAPGQSLPPADNAVALGEYLGHVRRLARDARLRDVYGLVIGSGYNALAANALAPDRPVTPAWYARVFNGAGTPPGATDNALAVARAENPRLRVLVGPVQPWNTEQDGAIPFAIDVPWLNYFHTLVAALDAAARAGAAAGWPGGAPDGFALHAPGRPGAPELAGGATAGQPGASAGDPGGTGDPGASGSSGGNGDGDADGAGAREPGMDLRRLGGGARDWRGAQAGFRVYRDWLAVINSFEATRGLPAYVTASNTFAPDEGVAPADNYPPGWLAAALAEVDGAPQVQALCWFVDGKPGDDQWAAFQLADPRGRLVEAAGEFDRLLMEEGR